MCPTVTWCMSVIIVLYLRFWHWCCEQLVNIDADHCSVTVVLFAILIKIWQIMDTLHEYLSVSINLREKVMDRKSVMFFWTSTDIWAIISSLRKTCKDSWILVLSNRTKTFLTWIYRPAYFMCVLYTVFTRIQCAIESNAHPSFGPLNFKKHFAHECNVHVNCGNLNKCTWIWHLNNTREFSLMWNLRLHQHRRCPIVSSCCLGCRRRYCPRRPKEGRHPCRLMR